MITVKFGGVLYHFILGRQPPPLAYCIVHRVVPGDGEGVDTVEMDRFLEFTVGVLSACTFGF